MVSHRISAMNESVTLKMGEKTKQLVKQGVNIIDFTVGEPDFDTPDFIKAAAVCALKDGFTKYTPASGIPELKNAIIHKLKKDNHLSYTPSQIIVSCGAKHSIFNAIQTLCNPGDEIIIPTPYWVSYPEQVKVSEAHCVYVPTDEHNQFQLTARAIAECISRRTKVIIINSPNNPTGTVYTAKNLKDIAELTARKNIFVISDEIYEKLVYRGTRHISIASFGKKIKDLTILINGVSKAYAMTGWRIGFAAGPEYLVKLMGRLQSHTTSNPTSIAQAAAVVAYQKGETSVRKMVRAFQARRDYLLNRLSEMPYLSCHRPTGAFYVFPDISKLFGKFYKGSIIKDSLGLTELLLTQAHIAVVPGIAFGNDKHIRFSYATSLRNIREGMNRLADFLREITDGNH